MVRGEAHDSGIGPHRDERTAPQPTHPLIACDRPQRDERTARLSTHPLIASLGHGQGRRGTAEDQAPRAKRVALAWSATCVATSAVMRAKRRATPSE